MIRRLRRRRFHPFDDGGRRLARVAGHGTSGTARCTCGHEAPTHAAINHWRDAGADADVDFWHPDNVAPFVAFLCSDASAHISGKVFEVQGGTSEAVIEKGGSRWAPAELVDRVGELFEATGMEPAPENGMGRLRFSMTSRWR